MFQTTNQYYITPLCLYNLIFETNPPGWIPDKTRPKDAATKSIGGIGRIGTTVVALNSFNWLKNP